MPVEGLTDLSGRYHEIPLCRIGEINNLPHRGSDGHGIWVSHPEFTFVNCRPSALHRKRTDIENSRQGPHRTEGMLEGDRVNRTPLPSFHFRAERSTKIFRGILQA